MSDRMFKRLIGSLLIIVGLYGGSAIGYWAMTNDTGWYTFANFIIGIIGGIISTGFGVVLLWITFDK